MKVVSCSADDRLANKWTQALHQVTDVFRTNAPATLEAYMAAANPDLVILHMDDVAVNIDVAVSFILKKIHCMYSLFTTILTTRMDWYF